MGAQLADASEDQLPRHRVLLSGFWISVTEISNEVFDGFKPDHATATAPFTHSSGAQSPAVWLCWEEAVGFCEWLAKNEDVDKSVYSLPTEAMWERAAKGDDERLYPWGAGVGGYRLNFCDANCAYAATKNANFDDGFTFSAPVDSFPMGAGPYGCLNMAGNVKEWCSDWYSPDYYDESAEKNPQGPKKGTAKVVRGGSFNYPIVDCITTARNSALPQERQMDIGFRVVRQP